MKRVLWGAMGLLVVIALIVTISRAYSVLDSVVFNDGPVPELSRLDKKSTEYLASLLIGRDTAELRRAAAGNAVMLRKFNKYPGTTLLHVLPAALMMLLAPMQFSRTIRSRYPSWHRWSGRIIVAIGIPIGLTGLFFGLFMPFDGVMEASAVAAFGFLFLYALVRAVMAIRARDITTHRAWMTRMFSIALGTSVVRLIGVVITFTITWDASKWFGISLWLGFGASLAVGEWWIRRSRKAQQAMAAPLQPA